MFELIHAVSAVATQLLELWLLNMIQHKLLFLRQFRVHDMLLVYLDLALKQALLMFELLERRIDILNRLLGVFEDLRFISSGAILLRRFATVDGISAFETAADAARLLHELLLELLKCWKVHGDSAACIAMNIDLLISLRWFDFLIGVDKLILTIERTKAAKKQIAAAIHLFLGLWKACAVRADLVLNLKHLA